jgi:hypothetical protein
MPTAPTGCCGTTGPAFCRCHDRPLGDPGAGQAVSWGDYDSDADLDLYVVNAGGPNKVLQNEGSGVFVDAMVDPITDPGAGLDAAWADFDLDGDLDLYLANEGGTKLFRNEIVFTRWLHVDLVGTISNASGIGARVRVVAGGLSQVREVSASSGNSLTAEFGLDGATAVDTLEVRWPSGTFQRQTGLAINQRLEIVEQPTSVELSASRQWAKSGGWYSPGRRAPRAIISDTTSGDRIRKDVNSPTIGG